MFSWLSQLPPFSFVLCASDHDFHGLRFKKEQYQLRLKELRVPSATLAQGELAVIALGLPLPHLVRKPCSAFAEKKHRPIPSLPFG